MKKSVKQNIQEIKKLNEKMPKTLNEALNFEDSDFDMEEPIEVPAVQENPSEKAKKLIDDIRKMALKAMAELADMPDSPEYQLLKRVWQSVEKKPEQEKNNIQ